MRRLGRRGLRSRSRLGLGSLPLGVLAALVLLRGLVGGTRLERLPRGGRGRRLLEGRTGLGLSRLLRRGLGLPALGRRVTRLAGLLVLLG
ncbi:hypothetical protein, partial [Streptomyces apricus]